MRGGSAFRPRIAEDKPDNMFCVYNLLFEATDFVMQQLLDGPHGAVNKQSNLNILKCFINDGIAVKFGFVAIYINSQFVFFDRPFIS